jgi:streptomycin 6-kinase
LRERLQSAGSGGASCPTARSRCATGTSSRSACATGRERSSSGDLHHENILWSDERGWLAIDPSGVVGEREYETGALLRNPMPFLLDRPHPGRVLERRADQLAEALGLDGGRIRAWAWAQTHLAAAWSVQRREDPRYWLAVADLLEPFTTR